VGEDRWSVGVPEDFPVPEYPVVGEVFYKQPCRGVLWFGHGDTEELILSEIRLKKRLVCFLYKPLCFQWSALDLAMILQFVSE
jgi:hypothetical protein